MYKRTPTSTTSSEYVVNMVQKKPAVTKFAKCYICKTLDLYEIYQSLHHIQYRQYFTHRVHVYFKLKYFFHIQDPHRFMSTMANADDGDFVKTPIGLQVKVPKGVTIRFGQPSDLESIKKFSRDMNSYNGGDYLPGMCTIT